MGAGGKKGRSGPPGNLNGVRHPWRTFWRRRALRKADRWIVPVLFDYADGLVADHGGSDRVTAAQRRMIEIAQTARGATMLILAEAARRGFIREGESGAWDLAPGAKELPKFLAIEQRALGSLGLERRAEFPIYPDDDEVIIDVRDEDMAALPHAADDIARRKLPTPPEES